MKEIVRHQPRTTLAKLGGTRAPSKLYWQTMEGVTMRIEDMDTKHCFNSMKMIFNHLADLWGGKPVWFTRRYTDYDAMALTGPERLAKYVMIFVNEIDSRGDLPERYQIPYAEIKAQISSRTQALPQPAEVTP